MNKYRIARLIWEEGRKKPHLTIRYAEGLQNARAEIPVKISWNNNANAFWGLSKDRKTEYIISKI